MTIVKKKLKTNMVVCLSTVILLSIASIVLLVNNTPKDTIVPSGYVESYDSYRIADGDTLWTIAKDVKNKYPELSDVSTVDVISTIKDMNDCTDDIHAGSCIIVPTIERK